MGAEKYATKQPIDQRRNLNIPGEKRWQSNNYGHSKSSSKRKVIVIQAYLRNKKNLKQPSLTPKGIRKNQQNPHLVEGNKS